MKKFFIFTMVAVLALTTSCKDAKQGDKEAPAVSQQAEGLANKGFKAGTEETQSSPATAAEETSSADAPTAPDTSVPTAPSSQKVMVYSISSDGFLNIREMPSASSNILGRLLTGGKGAEYLGSTGSWHRVRYEGVEGFVHANYASVEGLDQQAQRTQTSGRKVYYVVISSFNDLNSAKKFTETLPDALDGSCIFRATQDGKTVYRLCPGSYYRRAKAQQLADNIRGYLERDVWIWESDGVAPCVYQGILPSGEVASPLPE